MLEHALVERLAAMAGNPAGLKRNEVVLALNRAGMFWSQFTEDAGQKFIRRLVKQVRYIGRTGSVTVQSIPRRSGKTPEEEPLISTSIGRPRRVL